ncbi:MAG: hypothetical protein QOE65_2889 [Solirubrobacteraceae bacterium]|nr:hypothetical protein [Solirubrobacteraceae bacterium]
MGAVALSLVAAAPAAAHLGRTNTGAVLNRGPLDPTTMSVGAKRAAEPPIVATPRANCLPGGIPEGTMQGRVSAADVAAGKVDKGYLCNLSVIGHSGSTGGFRVHRYVDRGGHECAYYDTTLLFPTNAFSLSAEPTGVAVLDMTDPRKPVRTDSLLTPAMQTPHESVNISVERGILAAVAGNPAAYPGVIDVYDISQDCRHPVLQFSGPGAIFGHESGMAPDGKTFYPTSIGTKHTTAVDITNPRLPVRLWEGAYGTHGMSVSDDGNRGYFASSDGLIIVDLSEIQARKPNPHVREISRLVWSNITIPQYAVPVTIKGKPYLVEVDEYSNNGGSGGSTNVAANGSRVGAARIIDISDERKPFVVSNIRLAVHQPENRAAIANDPGAQSVVQGYAGHYCNVPQRHEPGIVACSMILSGLRVFDIRDPYHPKEIAYHVAPPSNVSSTGGPYIDEKANWAMSQPAFAPERGEIWYSDGTSGFYVLRMDPRVWPFGTSAGGGSTARCLNNPGFVSVGTRSLGRRVALRFVRRARLPVRVEVFQVSAGRRVSAERLVARFDSRTGSLVWSGLANRGPRGQAGPGYYVVRYTMLRGGRPYDTRRLVLTRNAAGHFVRVTGLQRRVGCGLLDGFRLDRPVFGGTTGVSLTGTYRLAKRAKVTLTVTRGRTVVRRFATAERAGGRTYRFSLPSRALRRGDYTVRLLAQSGDDQVLSLLSARRL